MRQADRRKGHARTLLAGIDGWLRGWGVALLTVPSSCVPPGPTGGGRTEAVSTDTTTHCLSTPTIPPKNSLFPHNVLISRIP